MDWKKQISQLASGPLLNEVRELRRHLHRHPELSFKEFSTSAFIREKLDNWGITYNHPLVETGLVARIKGGNGEGRRIALRCDMDALPITEETNLDFRSKNPGVMHACGHDMHMASMLGCIRILDQLKAKLSGEVLFIFQPGEEKLPGGARLMLDEGLFGDQEPDFILAQHVLPDMVAGHVGFRPGMYMASSDEIYITVKGKGGHGALPDRIKDPVLMASHILISLQQEINRLAPSGVPTVLSFGRVQADGAVNVIPDRVELEGTFRSMDEKWREKAHGLIRQIANGIASSMGGSCEIEIRRGYPMLHNNEALTRFAMEKAGEFLGEDQVEEMDLRMTAEDFAWFTQDFPGMLYRFGVGTEGRKEVSPLHSSGFIANEDALYTGISLLAFLAAELTAAKSM